MPDHNQVMHRSDEIENSEYAQYTAVHPISLSHQDSGGGQEEYHRIVGPDDNSIIRSSGYSDTADLRRSQGTIGNATLSEVESDSSNAGGVQASLQFTTADGYIPIHDVPKELIRTRTGDSIFETDSVVGHFGRTYHGYKEGKYLLPNDFAEQDRLDFQHKAFRVLLGENLYLAPITNPRHVLDIATGTGIWTLEFAEQHPEAQIIGTDLSAIQPLNAQPNCTFIKDDAEEEWLFPVKFDYVHLRFVFSCFNDPKRMMQRAFDSMHSGGWIEYQDPSMAQAGSMDGNIDGTAFKRWSQSLIQGTAAALNRNIEVAPQYQDWMREVGFINVREERLLWPVGPWFKGDQRLHLTGAYMQRNFIDGAFLATWKMMIAAGLSDSEAQGLIDEAKKEILDERNRFYLVAYIVYGQKPSPSESN